MTEKGKNNFVCHQAWRPTRSTCGCLCDDVDMILYTKCCNRPAYKAVYRTDKNWFESRASGRFPWIAGWTIPKFVRG